MNHLTCITYDSSPILKVLIKTVSIGKENLGMLVRKLVKTNVSGISKKEVTLEGHIVTCGVTLRQSLSNPYR